MICEFCGAAHLMNGRCPLCGHDKEDSPEDKDSILSRRNISSEGHYFMPEAPGFGRSQTDTGRRVYADSRGVPKSLRFQVLARDNYTCQYCGRRAPEVRLEIDHMVSWKDGGRTSIENLVTSCRDCNRGKSARSVSH